MRRADFNRKAARQTALAEALGIGQSKLSSIRKGKAPIDDKAYRKAAILLGKDAEAIGVWLRDTAPDEAWLLAMACPPEGPRHLGYGLEVETACAAPATATAPEEEGEGGDH